MYSAVFFLVDLVALCDNKMKTAHWYLEGGLSRTSSELRI